MDLPIVTSSYKRSAYFTKSNNGFDSQAYKVWSECWGEWVIPLLNDIEALEGELAVLKSASKHNLLSRLHRFEIAANSIIKNNSMVIEHKQMEILKTLMRVSND